MEKNFADRLYAAIDKHQNPSVVGLDPQLDSIPDFIKEKNENKFGATFEAASASILDFNRSILKEIKGIVPAVKPQIAFYEQYGHHGVKAFEDTISEAKRLGFLVIVDGKRNDIGSTSEAYARAFLGHTSLFGEKKPVWYADALTVNAYLGSDGVIPFVNICKEYGKGIFVLVKTSNKGSAELQNLIVKDNSGANKTVYEVMAELVKAWGNDLVGEEGYTSIGAVVGATHPKEAEVVRKIIPQSFFLVPGYGAQGGTADDTIPNFNKDGFGAIVNSSRGILYAYKSKGSEKAREEDFALCARQAALDMKKQLQDSMKKADICPW